MIKDMKLEKLTIKPMAVLGERNSGDMMAASHLWQGETRLLKYFSQRPQSKL